MTTDNVITTSNAYSSYCDTNLNTKMKPINDFIEQLLVRLEEAQILMDVLKKNQTYSDSVTLLISHRNEFDRLCDKIDRVEELMGHVQNNLDKLEEDIVKKENDLGFGESSIKVPSIFTPLFKKNDKKDKTGSNTSPLNTQDYFAETAEIE